MEDILLFIAIGFGANIVDGCIGMAYGSIIATFFMLTGVPLLQISAGIHFSEIFTTMASATAHLSIKNVDFKLLKKIVYSGAIGGILGALTLSYVNGDALKPFVSIYLILIGYKLIRKSIRPRKRSKQPKKLPLLGLVGGFLDALCGGGWGPIVTGTLLTKSNRAKKTIGTVNCAEFFVTLSQSIVFFAVVGLSSLKIVFGLILGGVLAAPIAVYLIQKINPKILTLIIGLIIFISNIVVFIHCLIA